MKAILVESGKTARIIETDGQLASLQALVGGYIECLYPFDDEVAIICNEEGKLAGLPLNRALYDGYGKVYDVIAGNFLVVGIGEYEFGSLSDELADKFMARFNRPEYFVQNGDGIRAISL